MCLNLLKDRENVISIVYSPKKFRKIWENWEVMERRKLDKIFEFFDSYIKSYNLFYCAVSELPTSFIFRLNSEDFSKFFLSLDILFLTSSYERTHEKVQKNAKNFSDYSWIFMIFRFLEVFRTKLFCTVRYSHVLTIIRFPVKFHIGLYLSDHGGRWGKNGFIAKTVQKCDFTRVKTA